MNWYKYAKNPKLRFLSYNSYGELKVSINGTPYTYYDVSPYYANQFKWMIEKSRIPGGVIIQRLKPFSNLKRHEELTTPPSSSIPENFNPTQQKGSFS